MSREEQCDRFSDDLDALVKRYASEFDLSYGDVIAALEFKKYTLFQELEQRRGGE